MYIIVVGGGKVGFYLTSVLKEEGHEVLLIEKDLGRYMALETKLEELVFHGDGSEVHTLEAAGAARADVVAAVTGRDEDNLVICQVAKKRFGVPRVIGRVSNPRNEGAFRALGIESTISGTRVIYSLIVHEVDAGELIPLLPLHRGNMTIVEVKLKADSPALGQLVRELALPKDSILISILRGDDILIPRGETKLRRDDTILALVKKGAEKALKEVLV
ncbi:MAG: TrkA family potassium uptake protein [Firmicutes bacterium]|nr:TrkA family potassium uptake protein [Bacillota bacterium]MCL5038760.1 TrkA family potassium uptake protein [Bacillota bacterium]